MKFALLREIVENLAQNFFRTTGKIPTEREINQLVSNYALEEMQYKEAILQQLDVDDTIVKRRLIQKFQFISSQLPEESTTENELRIHFDNNRHLFSIPQKWYFEHVFFWGRIGPKLCSR